MVVGDMRVFTYGNRHVLNLQRDVPLAASVDERHLFEDWASGSRGDCVGLAAAYVGIRTQAGARSARPLLHGIYN